MRIKLSIRNSFQAKIYGLIDLLDMQIIGRMKLLPQRELPHKEYLKTRNRQDLAKE